MIGRAAVWVLMLAFAAVFPLGVALADDVAVVRRDSDVAEVTAVDDDGDDGDTNSKSGYTSGDNSNDRTGSGHTGVSRDRDRSRGDKTRDRTKDGPGSGNRDWSGGQTNDRSREDSR
jgi:hypothetical protein